MTMAIYVLDKNLAAAWPVLAFTPPQMTLSEAWENWTGQPGLRRLGSRKMDKKDTRLEEPIHWPINLPILGGDLITILHALV